MNRHFLPVAAWLTLCAVSPVSAQQAAPAGGAQTPNSAQESAPQALPEAPPALPPVVLDTLGNQIGAAQQTAHARGLQGRILWIDAGANIGALNSVQKIQEIVGKVKASGINMIVLDVKPIVGETIYPSKYAPRLTEWKGQKVSPDLDVLKEVLTASHAAGIPVYANMSTFGEGHKFVKRGLAYTNPDWQTILYEVDRSVSAGGAPVSISAVEDLPAKDNTLGVLTSGALLQKNHPGYRIAILNFDARVTAVYDGAELESAKPAIPLRGSALIGKGKAAQWLQQNASAGAILTYGAVPKFVPIVDAAEQKFTMFCDPIHPDVRRHELDIVREIVTRYDVDGLVFDDRLRYAGLNADFGPRSRAAFEAVVGHTLIWPDDVFRTSVYPGQAPAFGPYYQRWLEWRAGNITSWLREAAQTARSIKPQTQVAVYVGSWYGDYEFYGSNWASPDFTAPYRWFTPAYRQTGYADQLDWITTGCYYTPATIDEVLKHGGDLGATVEAAGQLSNRVVDDAAWTYAGLYALSYFGHPDQFARAIEAAGASSQGVMIFDMSQIIQYDWWHVMAAAFAAPAQPPNGVPGLLAQVRQQHDAAKTAGAPALPLPPYVGRSETGF